MYPNWGLRKRIQKEMYKNTTTDGDSCWHEHVFLHIVRRICGKLIPLCYACVWTNAANIPFNPIAIFHTWKFCASLIYLPVFSKLYVLACVYVSSGWISQNICAIHHQTSVWLCVYLVLFLKKHKGTLPSKHSNSRMQFKFSSVFYDPWWHLDVRILCAEQIAPRLP